MRKLWAAIRRASPFVRRAGVEPPQLTEKKVTHNVYSPIEEHLRKDSEELGDDLIRLAKKHDVPLTFDLLRLHPVEARAELSMSIARVVVNKE